MNRLPGHSPGMSSNEPKTLLRVLAGETVSPPPIWLMRQAGRYLAEYRQLREGAESFLDFCYTPDMAVEATLQPIRRFGFDASILFSDILVIPHGLGQPVAFQTGEGPVLEPVRDAAGLDGLRLDGLLDHLEPVYETVRRLSRELPEPVTLIGFSGAPWTLATYMVEGRGGTDFSTVRDWGLTDPKTFGRLMDLLVEAVIRHLSAQISAGAEVVQIFDSWAGVLSEPEFHRWVLEPTARIVAGLRERHPHVPIIGFPKGAGALYLDYVRDTNVNGVSLDAQTPLRWAADHLQPLCAVQGNLDNRLLLAGGEQMDHEIRRILDILGGGPHIFNLGHGILPPTPVAHVERLISLVRQ